MSMIAGVLKQLRTVFRRNASERELSDELLFHVDMETAHNIERGMSPADARRAAMVAFGGVDRYAEQVRQARWTRVLDDLAADVRYAGRMLVRRPGFTLAVIATLGLGIGGTTAIFSVVDGLFLRAPAGVRAPETLRRIYMVRDEGMITTAEGGPGSWVDYTAMRGVDAFEGVAAFTSQRADLGRGPDAQQIWMSVVTHEFLPLLGVRPQLGRLFLPQEDTVPGTHLVAVLSHGMWQQHFGGARDAIGSTLLVNGELLEVVGVLEPGFTGITSDPIDVFVPASTEIENRQVTGMARIDYVARLAPDVTETVALEEANAALRAAAAEGLDPTPHTLATTLVPAALPGGSVAAALTLWLVLVAALVLVIACTNVGNLLLARSMTRRRELAVRLSLGAGRGRIVRQHLTESLVLALLGGAAGVLLAVWSMGLMRRFPLPPSAGHLDLRLLTFAFALSLLTGLLFGVVPALRAVRFDPADGMRETRVVGTRAHQRMRRTLLAVQVALSLALLVGAALFVRSLRAAYAVDAGVDMPRLLAVNVNVGRAGYTPEQQEVFWQDALHRVRGLPGVEDAAMVHFAPLDGSGMGASWDAPGRDTVSFDEGPYLNLAGPGYFDVAGTNVLQGRGFLPEDAYGEPVAVVNERMAQGIAPGGSALNACIAIRAQIEDGGCTRIVGIVETQRRRYLDAAPIPMIFLPRARDPRAITWGGPALIVRARGDAADMTAQVREVLQGLRADLPFVKVEAVQDKIRRDVLPLQLGATLFSLFGILAVALAGVGLNGVLGYYVAERTPEIGLRRSLGAQVSGVVSLVMRQGLVPVAIGVVAGLAAAYGGTRFLASLLFGVDARDPLAFGAAAAFLLLVALIATALPARRAARIEPMVALRQD